MLAFWAVLGAVVGLDWLFWLLENIPVEEQRLWPVTDEELRVRQAYSAPTLERLNVDSPLLRANGHIKAALRPAPRALRRGSPILRGSGHIEATRCDAARRDA